MKILFSKRRAAVSALAVSLLAFTAACGGDTADEGSPDDSDECKRNRETPITYVAGYGYSASAGQIDVYLAEDLGYFDELCLDVTINDAGGNGQQLVSAGKAQFTELGSAEDVLMAAANSENLTAIATYGSTSPFCIFANEKVTDLKDLEGGTLGYFINLTPAASAMLDAAGVDESKVDLISMTNYDPTVVLRDQVDAIVGYSSNQCATLDAMDAEYSKFLPEDYDVPGTYNVMEVNTEFLAENREVTEDFMRSTLRALDYCLENEEDCVDRLTRLADEAGQGDAFPKEQNIRTWSVESEWVRQKDTPPGVIEEADWENSAEIVKEYGSVQDIPPVQDVIDIELVAGLYDDEGNLIWPEDAK